MKVSELKTILNAIELPTDNIPIKVKLEFDDGSYTIRNIVSFREYSDCIVLNAEKD